MAKTILEFLGLLTAAYRYADQRTYYQSCKCPFLAYEKTETAYCRKTKKATREELEQRGRWWATLGSCVVSDADGAPVVICPHKLEMGDRFVRDLMPYFHGNPQVIHEAALESGRVDWVLRGESVSGSLHTIAVEIQALDTTATGGINDAKRSFEHGDADFLARDFLFGFNWKMSIKTIIFQVLSKISETVELNWSYVLFVQDLFLRKMEELYNVKFAAADGKSPSEILSATLKGDLLIHAYRFEPGAVTHTLDGPAKFLVSRNQLIQMLALQTDRASVERRLGAAQASRGRPPLSREQLREHLQGCGIPEHLRDSLFREL